MAEAGQSETQAGQGLQTAGSAVMMVPGWGTVVGGAMVAAGAGLSMLGAHDRDKAMQRVMRRRRAEEERYGHEQYRISDNLRKAMEGVALAHGEELTAYMEDRNGPARIAAAEEAQVRQETAGQSGMDRALAALAGPDTVRAPVQQVYTDSLNTNLADQKPGLQALLDQISNSGYLTGLENYDTGNRQGMDLRLAPLQNVVGNEQLIGGVESADNQRFNQLMRQHLGLKALDAEQAGNGKMLAGALAGLVGQGISAYGAANPSTQTQAPAQIDPTILRTNDAVPKYVSPLTYQRQPGGPNIDPVWSAENL